MSYSMRVCAMAVALAALHADLAVAVVSYTGGAYTQDFDTLPLPATPTTATVPWANNSTLPDWEIYLATGAAVTAIRGDAGTNNTGGFYSWGTGTSTERALGGIGSSNVNASGYWAVGLANDTAATIDEVTIEFDGEQWRSGGAVIPTLPSPQTMLMEYGIGTGFFDVSTWIAPGGNFDWTSPVVLQAGVSVDGNGLGLVADRGGELSTLGWAAGSNLWIRWIERNDGGNDHGLAIDNFSLSAEVVGPTINANFDGADGVNGNDFLIWQQGLGSGTTLAQGDSNGSNSVDATDLDNWKAQFGTPAVAAVGAVPEPGAIALAGAALAGVLGVVRRRSGR